MTPETNVVRTAGGTATVSLHESIKCRAYELYTQCATIRDNDLNDRLQDDRLQAELPRVVYAVAELQMYTKGEVGDTRAVRAARVYLRALAAFIGERDGD